MCMENQTRRDYHIPSCNYNPDLVFCNTADNGYTKKTLTPAKIEHFFAQFFPVFPWQQQKAKQKSIKQKKNHQDGC